MNKVVVTLAISALLAGAGNLQAADKPVPYPDGYRDWHHIKSMVIPTRPPA